MPVELVLESWQTVDWDAVKTREDLILARMQQLDHRHISESIAAENLRNSRKANKIYFDQHHRLRPLNQRLQRETLFLYMTAPCRQIGTRNSTIGGEDLSALSRKPRIPHFINLKSWMELLCQELPLGTE